MKEELINKILNKEMASFDALDDYWVIIIKNKLFCPRHGATFHDTKEQAWKHFYNEFNWRVKSEYKKDYADSIGVGYYTHGLSYPKTSRAVWEEFKNDLFVMFNFRIVQWKDAKRDVCGEIRAEGND